MAAVCEGKAIGRVREMARPISVAKEFRIKNNFQSGYRSKG